MRNRILIAASLLGTALSLDAENWPRFRGPSGQGISTETNLPLHWSAESNVVWKTPVPGEGWSSPIVFGERVFVASATDAGSVCRVVCLDRRSGTISWNKELFTQVPLRKERKNSYATPTPVTDGERVYAVFGDGSFAALTMDGRLEWTNRDHKFYSQHGLGASPILYRDLLIMPFDGSSSGEDKKVGWQIPWDQAVIVALDKDNGKVRWKARRGLSRIAHVTPNVFQLDGRDQLVSAAGDVIQGFDLQNGELLWTVRSEGEGVVPSVVIGDDLVFAASGFPLKVMRATRPASKGGEAEIVWEQNKGVPSQSSFIYLKQHIFAITEGGVATCYRADNGEVVWQERVGGNHSASPVSGAGRIYFLSEEGESVVIEAKAEFKILARNNIGERCQASMAISQGNVFIRSENSLFCIGTSAE